ncbi:MAG: hypothetical protein HGA51_09870 [Demequinaceae bacterium]|nr:hypothetical protein [Demequinaceae bacterium]
MRWDDLFADLEAQLSAAEHAQFQLEVQDLTRSERAGIELAARLVSAKGMTVALTLTDGETARGVLVDAAAQWLLLGATGPQTLVPVRAITLVSGLPPRTAELTEIDKRLGLGHALRALARDRARVVVDTVGGSASGLVGVVGADFIEVSTTVGASVAVPMAAIIRVRAAG